jgi:hypothetical protein
MSHGRGGVWSSSAPQIASEDPSGRRGWNGVFQETVVAQMYPEISMKFQYGILESEIISDSTGTGVIDNTDRMLNVKSGSSGTAYARSRNPSIYRAGQTNFAQFTASFTGNGKGKAGIFDSEDGMYIQLDDGVPSFHFLTSGVPTNILNTEVNGVVNLSEIDFTKVHVYRIVFGHLGVAPIYYEILHPELRVFLPMHVAETHYTRTTAHTTNPTLNIRFEAESTVNGDITLRSASWNAGILDGAKETRGIPFSKSFLVSGVPNDGNKHLIAAFQNKTTFNTFTNKVAGKLYFLQWIAYFNTALVELSLDFIPTITPAVPAWTDIRTGESVFEYFSQPDLTITDYIVTGGFEGINLGQYPYVGLGTSGARLSSADAAVGEVLGLELYAGEYVGISAKVLDTQATFPPDIKIYLSLVWREFR